MQSSSRLFPVALLGAELCGDLSEDVYLLKPRNSPDASVELAVTRLGRAEAPGVRGTPVILLHGSFTNRRFWFSPKGIGFGAHLARAGFDVWIPEMRGHGLSPRNRAYRHNRVADYARYDLPAIADFVIEQSGQAPHWMGHSLGGVVLAAAAGGGYLDERNAASLTLLGSQVSQVYLPLKLPPVEWGAHLLLSCLPHLSGERLRQGPEDEPIGVAREALRWHGLFGRFRSGGENWWQGLAQVRVPVLAVSAEGDRQDRPASCERLLRLFGSDTREHLCLGPRSGFSSPFGHVEMLISKAAQREVWPRLVDWLLSQGAEPAPIEGGGATKGKGERKALC